MPYVISHDVFKGSAIYIIHLTGLLLMLLLNASDLRVSYCLSRCSAAVTYRPLAVRLRGIQHRATRGTWAEQPRRAAHQQQVGQYR